MKIALFGYGKMGKEIEQIALQRGHEIVLKIKGTEEYDISQADIAIDFSIPNAALSNIVSCFRNNVPVISGTTGWLDDFDKAIDVCKENNGSFIYASNFSIGVNIFFELNKQLAKMMNSQKEYSINVEEIHHTEKKDAPSGTAITLVEDLLPYTDKNTWSLDNTTPDAIGIKSRREADVKGTHSVSFASKIDTITIKHEAHSREGFAIGAVIAAEFLIDKKGIFTMKDVLGL